MNSCLSHHHRHHRHRRHRRHCLLVDHRMVAGLRTVSRI